MRINIGSDVITVDGEKVGSVERLVLDSASKTVDKLVVSSGFLGQHDRLVDLDLVDSAGETGVHLVIDRSQFEEMPDFVEERFIVADPEDLHGFDYIQPGAAGGTYLFGAPYIGRGYEGGQDSFFDSAPVVAPIVETRSNIRDVDVLIGEGTDVFDVEGDKVGTVDKVITEDGGQVVGFVVRKGLIFRHDVRIPMEFVDSAAEDRITLNIDSDDIDTLSYDVEETTL